MMISKDYDTLGYFWSIMVVNKSLFRVKGSITRRTDQLSYYKIISSQRVHVAHFFPVYKQQFDTAKGWHQAKQRLHQDNQ